VSPSKSHDTSKNVTIKVLPLTQDDTITEFTGSSPLENFGIDLASARSVDSLERHWDYLSRSNPELLDGVKPHYVGKGTAELPLFTLVAGPFKRMADARILCKKLAKENIDCHETRYNDKEMQNLHTANTTIQKLK